MDTNSREWKVRQPNRARRIEPMELEERQEFIADCGLRIADWFVDVGNAEFLIRRC